MIVWRISFISSFHNHDEAAHTVFHVCIRALFRRLQMDIDTVHQLSTTQNLCV